MQRFPLLFLLNEPTNSPLEGQIWQRTLNSQLYLCSLQFMEEDKNHILSENLPF